MAKAKPAVKTPGTAVARAKINLPVDANEQMAREVAALANRIQAPSGNKIAITQDKQFKLPNGDADDTMQGIIVDFVSYNAYYDKPYNPNDITPPNCFALGEVPSELSRSDNSPDPQCDGPCAGCWANQWKSSPTSNGKACGNHKLLAILPPNADAETPLMLLKVSPTGLKSFDGYVASVARNFQRPPYGVITEVSFDENSTYATLRFGNPQPCSTDQLALAMSRREEARAMLLIEPDVSSFEKDAPKGKSKLAPARGKPPQRKAA